MVGRAVPEITPLQLAELGCYLEKMLTASPCNHTLRHTQVSLECSDLPNPDSGRAALEDRGGYCDCEVLHNVVR